MNDIILYDWVPFYDKICSKIYALSGCSDRNESLFLLAEKTFLPSDPILRFPYVDPFSFLYALAQRNTRNNYHSYYTRAGETFDVDVPVPTDRVFPTPTPNSKSLFYDGGEYITNEGENIGSGCIWDLFSQVFKSGSIKNEDFIAVLSLKNVGVSKLTQVLFLVCPEKFIPLETRMNSLPISELGNLSECIVKIRTYGAGPYLDAVDILGKSFPGCKMYEINYLNWVINSPYEDSLRLTNAYCQISSNVEGKRNKDYYDDFIKNNAVWTGGPSGLTGKQLYPFHNFSAGDIVLLRRGTKRLGGIGIIISNGYLPSGWNENSTIQVVWLNKQPREISDDKLGQWIGFDRATTKTLELFKAVYPDTFKILDLVRRKQKSMINHSINPNKNIILTGPPGTGKTRKALQLARWLTRGTDHSISLTRALELGTMDVEPNIDDIEEAEIVQFHPSYSYEDFVRGISTTVVDGKIAYQVENRSLAKIAAEASKIENLSRAYVLIIDEINRANLSSVLGELIYALEYRGAKVKSIYTLGEDSHICIPPNLYIIGTMNTADRSLGNIDYAIRRRFIFVQISPDLNAITHSAARKLYTEVERIIVNFITPDFSLDDVKIGHSYFLVDPASLSDVLKFSIRPILIEYIRDGILLEAARNQIELLNV